MKLYTASIVLLCGLGVMSSGFAEGGKGGGSAWMGQKCTIDGKYSGKLMEVFAKAAHANKDSLATATASCTGKKGGAAQTIVAKNISLKDCKEGKCTLHIDSLVHSDLNVEHVKIDQ